MIFFGRVVIVIFYEHGPGVYIKSLQFTPLFAWVELGVISAGVVGMGLVLATPVTFTLLCGVKLTLLPHENLAVILFCPNLIRAGAKL